MAYYFLFPEKDSTIYSHPFRQDLNTGIEETLELASELDNTGSLYYPSRFLVQFNDDEIKSVLNDKVSGVFSSSINIFNTEFNKTLPKTLTLELFPLSQSWENGTQRYNKHPNFANITSNGCSWLYTDDGTLVTSWNTGSFGTGTTASFIDSAKGGGVWYTGSGFEHSQSFNIVNDFDINLDITSIIKKYTSSFNGGVYPDGIPNNGFIIKRKDDFFGGTTNTTDQGKLNYFGIDTNTIFSPNLAIKWDDSSYNVSDSDILKKGKIQLSINNNKKFFKNSEEYTFRLDVRPQFPARTFVTSSNFLQTHYLTSKSFYSIEDYTSNEVIIPFDESFTKISTDEDGMFFKIYMNGLQPERYYRILIKNENSEGISVFNDKNIGGDCYFKVIR